MEKDFKNWVKGLSIEYQNTQIRATVRISNELILYYVYLGREVAETSFKKKYGSKFYENLSDQLKTELPKAKGFSPQNIRYIESFYTLYSKIFPQLVGEFKNNVISGDFSLINKEHSDEGNAFIVKLSLVPWGHHRCIIDAAKGDSKKALFYVNKVIQNGWSRSQLEFHIANHLYDREGNNVNNFNQLNIDINGIVSSGLTKDPFIFDVAEIREDYKEKELKDALVGNLKNTLLKELDKGYAFVGEEYRISVGHSDFYIDLLFYLIPEHRYVVIELKNTRFKPEYLGQLNLYVNAINKDVKGKDDNETIGILMCKEKDNTVVQYSLNGFQIPLGVSSFNIQNLLPKDFKSELPTIEELEKDKKNN